MTRKTIRHSEGKPEESVSTMFYKFTFKRCWSSTWHSGYCHPELSWILFHKKSLLTTLRYRSSDFLFLRVCAIASPYANPLISGSILKDTSLRSVWRIPFPSFWTHEVGEESILFKFSVYLFLLVLLAAKVPQNCPLATTWLVLVNSTRVAKLANAQTVATSLLFR